MDLGNGFDGIDVTFGVGNILSKRPNQCYKRITKSRPENINNHCSVLGEGLTDDTNDEVSGPTKFSINFTKSKKTFKFTLQLKKQLSTYHQKTNL